jgi:hypothetical protein
MIIKSFSEFNESNLDESYYDQYHETHGKTSFTRWLRKIGDKIGIGDSGYTSYYADSDPNSDAILSGRRAIAATVSGLAKGTASFIDFLSPGEDIKSWKDLDKEEIKRRKEEIIRKWEAEHIENKHVTDHDAEEFYKSGVLRGKKYFGNDFKPQDPKSKDEEIYRDYLRDVMNTYYRKTKKKK